MNRRVFLSLLPAIPAGVKALAKQETYEAAKERLLLEHSLHMEKLLRDNDTVDALAYSINEARIRGYNDFRGRRPHYILFDDKESTNSW